MLTQSGPWRKQNVPPGPFMNYLLTEVLELRVQTRDGKASSDQQQWEALSPLSLKGLGRAGVGQDSYWDPVQARSGRTGQKLWRDTISTWTRDTEAAGRQASNIQLLVSPLICEGLSLANREPADQQARQIQFTQARRRMRMDWGRDTRGTG